MYCLRSALIGQPIISLQTGQIVAWAKEPIIELSKLEITGLSCQTPQDRHALILMAQDIRQYATDCIIIDDEDQLTDPKDIVRLKINLEEHYTPLRKAVVTESGTKLGNVSDYTLNLETNRIQQLHVIKSLLHAWIGSNLVIDRAEILDITPNRITVRDTTIPTTVLSPKSLPEI